MTFSELPGNLRLLLAELRSRVMLEGDLPTEAHFWMRELHECRDVGFMVRHGQEHVQRMLVVAAKMGANLVAITGSCNIACVGKEGEESDDLYERVRELDIQSLPNHQHVCMVIAEDRNFEFTIMASQHGRTIGDWDIRVTRQAEGSIRDNVPFHGNYKRAGII
jgi:hypothetical protein